MRPRTLTWARPARLLLGAGALSLSLLLSPPPVHAELAPGAEAVQVDAQDYVNTEPVTLLDLRGRVSLLELWKTT